MAEWFRRYWADTIRHPDKDPLTFGTFTVTLTLNTAVQFSHMTLWLMMMYHQTKFGCKRIRSQEDIVETIIFWLCKLYSWLIVIVVGFLLHDWQHNTSYCSSLFIFILVLQVQYTHNGAVWYRAREKVRRHRKRGSVLEGRECPAATLTAASIAASHMLALTQGWFQN